MTGGVKIAIGVSALIAVGGVAWWAMSRSPAAVPANDTAANMNELVDVASKLTGRQPIVDVDTPVATGNGVDSVSARAPVMVTQAVPIMTRTPLNSDTVMLSGADARGAGNIGLT